MSHSAYVAVCSRPPHPVDALRSPAHIGAMSVVTSESSRILFDDTTIGLQQSMKQGVWSHRGRSSLVAADRCRRSASRNLWHGAAGTWQAVMYIVEIMAVPRH